MERINALFASFLNDYEAPRPKAIIGNVGMSFFPCCVLVGGLLRQEGRRFDLIPSPDPDFRDISFDGLTRNIGGMVDPACYGVLFADLGWIFDPGTCMKIKPPIKKKFLKLVDQLKRNSGDWTLDRFRRGKKSWIDVS